MDSRFVEEIVQMINGNVDISDYYDDVKNAILNRTQKRFMNHFNTALDFYRKESFEEASEEINLLNSMKPFINEDKKQQIDKIVQVLGDAKAIHKIIGDVQQVRTSSIEPIGRNIVSATSYTPDDLIDGGNTVYEIEPECYHKRKSENKSVFNFIPMMLLLLIMKR